MRYMHMRRHLCTLTKTLTLLALVLASQPSLAESEPILDTSRYVWVAQTATHEGRVRVTITKQRPKLHLAKSHRPVAKLVFDSQDDDYYNDLPEVQVGYRRPELIDTEIADAVSDDIKIRLALARLKAVRRHQEIWS